MMNGCLCTCSPVADARFDPGGEITPKEAVIEALAEAIGESPLGTPQLAEFVDPDALDRVVRSSRREGSRTPTLLRFEVDGWHVFVRGDGRVRVCDSDGPVEPAPVFER